MRLNLPFKRAVQDLKQSRNESRYADLHWKRLAMLYCSQHCGHTPGPISLCYIPLCKAIPFRLTSRSFSGKHRNDLGLSRANRETKAFQSLSSAWAFLCHKALDCRMLSSVTLQMCSSGFLLAVLSSGPKAIERSLPILTLSFLVVAFQPRQHHHMLVLVFLFLWRERLIVILWVVCLLLELMVNFSISPQEKRFPSVEVCYIRVEKKSSVHQKTVC